MKRSPRITAPFRLAFLEALSEGWSAVEAAQRTGISRRAFYRLREKDAGFAAAWDEAIIVGCERLEDELLRRSREGWDEDTFDGEGELVRRVRRKSPSDIYKLLAARKPEYRDGVQVTAIGGPVVMAGAELADGYQPTTLRDVVELAAGLGVLEQLGYVRADVIDGEAVEVPELTEATGG